jgi:diguanylate cyclase (GGDEF)-like protein
MKTAGRRVCKSLILFIFGLLSYSVCADIQRFDTLINKLDKGEVVLYDRVSAELFLKQLEPQLPPDDFIRQSRMDIEKCLWLFTDKPEQGIAFAERYINDERLSENYAYLSQYLQCRALHLSYQGALAAQTADLQQAIALANKSEDAKSQAQALLQMAEVHSTRGQHADALMLLFRSYDFYTKIGHVAGTNLTLEAIATAYRRMGEFDKALEYLSISERDYAQPNDKARTAYILQQKAFVYGELGNTAGARQLLIEVHQIYSELGEQTYALGVLVDRMWVINLEQKYAESLELAGKIEAQLQAFRRQNPDYALYNEDLFFLLKAEALAETGQLASASNLFEKAEIMLKQEENPRYMLRLQRAWARAQAKNNQFESAYRHLVHAEAIEEQLNSQLKQQREALLRYQFDSELQSRKNDQLVEENLLSEQQVATLESAQRWQYIAIALFVVLALIALLYAISQIKRNRRLQLLAMTDELTQVANRRSILLYAEQTRIKAQHEHKSWSLLLVDIDHFKQCNDTYGHDAGDEVLVAVAHAMQSVLRHVDRLGRSGGEEFLLVLPETNAHSAYDVAERLRIAVAGLKYPSYPELQITISVGVTQAGRQEEIKEVISRADAALYQAKSDGRNRIVLT